MSSIAEYPIDLQATAVLTGSVLSGAMLGLSAIAVPVLLDTDKESSHLLAHFVRLYHYGHRIMPTLGIATTVLYFISFAKARGLDGSSTLPLWAGITTISLVPFTWIAMTPTNYKLFDLHDSEKINGGTSLTLVQDLVTKWAKLHVIRSLFPLLGAIAGGRDLLAQLR